MQCFNGRARRAEYWYFVLFNAIVSIILGILGKAIVYLNITIGTIGSEINILSIHIQFGSIDTWISCCSKKIT